jgi:hypothetical protein
MLRVLMGKRKGQTLFEFDLLGLGLHLPVAWFYLDILTGRILGRLGKYPNAHFERWIERKTTWANTEGPPLEDKPGYQLTCFDSAVCLDKHKVVLLEKRERALCLYPSHSVVLRCRAFLCFGLDCCFAFRVYLRLVLAVAQLGDALAE